MNFKPRIAIVQDALVVSGGSERVAAALCQVFPEADLFTSVYLPDRTYPFFKNITVRTLPGSLFINSEKNFKRTYPFWLLGFFMLDLSKYDVIITSSSYAAKFIRKPQKSIHICYLHNPIRFIWNRDSYENTSLPFNKQFIKLIDLFIPFLRKLDSYFTKKIDIIISNSQNIAKKTKDIYQRESIVIYPPIESEKFSNNEQKKDFYIYVGRLLSYKRVDLAIKACKELNKKLVIVGIGPEFDELKKISNDLIEFRGLVTEESLITLYAQAKGLIFPGKEDFGLVPVEAQASGCPIIAYREGGALETVKDGETGVFFEKQDVKSLVNAIRRFEYQNFDKKQIILNAKSFDFSFFSNQIKNIVENSIQNAGNSHGDCGEIHTVWGDDKLVKFILN